MKSLKDCTGYNYGTRPDPMAIIKKYYEPGSESFEYIVKRGEMVAEKALEIAERSQWLPPGFQFIYEASMLHDIGIFLTDAPHLGCHGDYPYIAHGYLGRDILYEEGYPLHALVCERHLGVGVTAEEVRDKGLPLPERDMVPITPEEQIICFADKLFPASPGGTLSQRGLSEAREEISAYGKKQLRKFDRWATMYQEVNPA